MRRLYIGCFFASFFLVISCTKKPIEKSPPQVDIKTELDQSTTKHETAPVSEIKTTHSPKNKKKSDRYTKAPPETSKPSVVTIDNEGRLIVNGKPFFIIGLYAVPKDRFSEVKELGFNSVQTYRGEGQKSIFRMSGRTREMRDYLQVAHKHDLMVWMGLPRYEIDRDYTPVIERQINTLKKSPALLSWYIYDEPDCDNIPFHKISYITQMVHRQDPNHPALLVLCRYDKKSQQYYSIPDIIITDFYPIGRPGAKISDVTKKIQKTRAAMIYKKPLWNVIQLHGKGKGGHGFGMKEPSYKEVRNMIYQSIIAGAKGLLFFMYHGRQFKLHKSPEGMKNIKKLTTELHKLIPILLSDSPKNKPVQTNKISALKTRLFIYKQKSYLFVVNVSRKPATIHVTAKEKTASNISVLFDNRTIKLIKNKFSEKIEPLGVRVYQF